MQARMAHQRRLAYRSLFQIVDPGHFLQVVQSSEEGLVDEAAVLEGMGEPAAPSSLVQKELNSWAEDC